MPELPPPLRSLFRDRGRHGRRLDVVLPPGRVIDSLDKGWPALWLSDGPAPARLWARLRAAHRDSGLWPLILDGLRGDEARPWANGELTPRRMSSPGTHDAEALLARMWARCTAGAEEEVLADLAPFGSAWPGIAVRPTVVDDPDETADECAETLRAEMPAARLGLVATDRGADAIAVVGWSGPLNYDSDAGRFAAVLRGWEVRFGARVVGVGFDTLHLSVAAPPRTEDDALRVAAEHYAFCPDNVRQGSGTLTDYARDILGHRMWGFWWD